MRTTLGRREFLKKATQAVATVAVCEGMTPAPVRAETPQQSPGTIPTRTLGKTGSAKRYDTDAIKKMRID